MPPCCSIRPAPVRANRSCGSPRALSRGWFTSAATRRAGPRMPPCLPPPGTGWRSSAGRPVPLVDPCRAGEPVCAVGRIRVNHRRPDPFVVRRDRSRRLRHRLEPPAPCGSFETAFQLSASRPPQDKRIWRLTFSNRCSSQPVALANADQTKLMGPTSLPAPRSPWRFRRFGRSPYPGFAVGRVATVMRCRTPRAHRTGGVLHRDARRIGPVQVRPIGEPIRPFPFVLSRTIRWLDESRLSSPQPSWCRSRQTVASTPGGPLPAVWRFRDYLWTLPSGTFVPLRRSAAFQPSFPGAPRQPSGRAPLTASAVRQACSGELARRVFRRCCGHRCRIVRLCFPLAIQAVRPGSSVRFHPSDT